MLENAYYIDPSTTGDYNAVMDGGFAVPTADFDDTGSIYDDISTWHQQTLQFLKGAGANLDASQNQRVYEVFRDMQLSATSPNKYAVTEAGHHKVMGIASEAFRGNVPAKLTADLLQHFQNMQRALGAGGGVLGALSSVASGAAGLVSQGTHLLQQGLGAITNNPLWDIAKTGISFIPGVGTAVSAGMAGAAALGRGESLANIGLAAARGALPGGAVTQAAFDAAVGLAKGQNVTDAILQAARSQVPGGDVGKAAFDAATAIAKGHALSDVAINAIRNNVPGGSMGKAAFDAAIQNFRSKTPGAAAVPSYPVLSQTANAAARAIHASPVLQRTPARQVASDLKTDVANVQRAIAAIMNRLGGTQLFSAGDVGAIDSLEDCCAREGVPSMSNTMGYDTAAFESVYGGHRSIRVPVSHAYLHAMARRSPMIRQAILAHGMIPRLFHNTGELDGAGGWIIRSGDTGSGVAKKVTGNANRWRELLAANPGMSTFTASNGSTQIKPWNIGQRVTLPASWLGTAVAVPNPPTPAGPSSPVARPATTTFPPSSQAASLPQIQKGSSGSAVVMWQSLLLKLGSKIIDQADGSFGPITDTATRAYQLRMGLTPPDGVVGPLTWGAALRELEGKGAAPSTPVATPAAPPSVGPAVPSSSNVPQLAAVQAGLAGFYLHHAGEVTSGDFANASTNPFGSSPDDLAGTWTQRSQAAMQGFQNWWNRQAGNAHLPEDGQPDQASVNALITQTTADLRKVGETLPLPNLPTTPVIDLPGSATAPGGSVASAKRAPPAAATTTTPTTTKAAASSGGGDGVVAVAIGIAILAAIASQKGSRKAA